MRTVSAADVLIAGVDEELPAVRELMLLLPSTAYGQVMVETAADAALLALTTPPRVTVTQLGRGADAAPGDLLAVAVHAWLTEWTPEDADPDRAFTIWLGTSVRDRIDAQGATLESL
jgi:NADPH-dependent ferric siderophore reductase